VEKWRSGGIEEFIKFIKKKDKRYKV